VAGQLEENILKKEVLRAPERCGRVCSMGTSFVNLRVCMKIHATEGKQTL